jgi:hypothetical protein
MATPLPPTTTVWITMAMVSTETPVRTYAAITHGTETTPTATRASAWFAVPTAAASAGLV